jgi:uncharacterized protein YndB with AHSA1/START domain
MARGIEFRYVTYVGAPAQRLWDSITDPDTSVRYWGHRNVSDWRVGSRWEHQRRDGSGTADVVGTVLECAPPRRLRVTWALPGDRRDAGPTEVTVALDEHGPITRLTLVHGNLSDEAERDALASGWSAVLANLKTFVEVGRPLPAAPWEVPDVDW